MWAPYAFQRDWGWKGEGNRFAHGAGVALGRGVHLFPFGSGDGQQANICRGRSKINKLNVALSPIYGFLSYHLGAHVDDKPGQYL